MPSTIQTQQYVRMKKAYAFKVALVPAYAETEEAVEWLASADALYELLDESEKSDADQQLLE